MYSRLTSSYKSLILETKECSLGMFQFLLISSKPKKYIFNFIIFIYQYEIARTKVQEEMTQRLEVQKRREDQSKRQAEKRNKLAAEERRLKDLQKAALGEVDWYSQHW